MYAQQYRNVDPYWQTIENVAFSHRRRPAIRAIERLKRSFLHREVAKLERRMVSSPSPSTGPQQLANDNELSDETSAQQHPPEGLQRPTHSVGEIHVGEDDVRGAVEREVAPAQRALPDQRSHIIDDYRRHSRRLGRLGNPTWHTEH
jgi:hypothetical protein